MLKFLSLYHYIMSFWPKKYRKREEPKPEIKEAYNVSPRAARFSYDEAYSREPRLPQIPQISQIPQGKLITRGRGALGGAALSFLYSLWLTNNYSGESIEARLFGIVFGMAVSSLFFVPIGYTLGKAFE
jgi:hypothetical protein